MTPPLLDERLDAVRRALSRHLGETTDATTLASVPSDAEHPDGLALVAARAALTPFETDVLTLVAGCELDAGLRLLCARALGDASREYATFGLAMAALDGAHWDALAHTSPLRDLGLVRLDQRERGRGLTDSPLVMDESVVLFLLGLAVDGPELDAVAQPERAVLSWLPSRQNDTLLDVLAELDRSDEPIVVWGSTADREPFERSVAAATGARSLWRLVASGDLPDPADDGDLLRRLSREVRVFGAAAVLDLDDLEPARVARVSRWVRRLSESRVRVILSSREAVPGLRFHGPIFELPEASLGERVELWQHALDGASPDADVRRLAGQFRLAGDDAEAVATGALRSHGNGSLFDALWAASRVRARADLGGMAERMRPSAGWEDLVLPPREQHALRDLLRHTRHRSTVFEEWQLTGSGRGAGVTALFAGPSGTGKSLAAEVIASELAVDLYRVDLSQVVSKYIGETEKNLRRVFDAAERSGAVLVIDEADALFGQRTAVRDSHDRYANIEVSYLLQRMESYRGLAVLTTNLRANIDDAFVRRLGFIVTFPFPDPEQRNDLWQRAFGPGVPLAHLETRSLAQLTLSGGSIRNVAVNAAFLAAERGSPVTMSDVLEGARSEYGKLDRPLTSTETAGWEL